MLGGGGDWRSMSVSLNVETGQYVAGMAKAQTATRGFADGVKGAGTGMDGLESKAQKLNQVGGKLTRNLTLPLVAVAGASAKMAIDFNRAFTQMQGLAGVTGEEVDGLKASVLELSGETARAPQELAEGLYLTRSAGFEGAAAMDLLESAAKGAAIGMGDTATLVDVLSSTLNAYEGTSLTAAQATDQLVASIEQGKVAPDQMANEFGALLPVASELGIEFGELSGSLAFLTRTSGNASLSGTQLNGILNSMLKPSVQASQALGDVGWSVDEMRASIRERGLLETLIDLKGRLEDNGMEMSSVFENSRALAGALGLMRNDGEAATEVIGEVTGAVGNLDRAFDLMRESPEFQFEQSLAELKITAIEVGQELIPVLSRIAGGVGGIVGAFGELPGSVQTGLIMLGGVLMVAGPVTRAVGGVAQGIVLMNRAAQSEALAGLVSRLGGARVAAGLAGGAIGLAAVGFTLWASKQAEAKAKAAEWTAEMRLMAEETITAGKAIEDVFATRVLTDWATDNADLLDAWGVSLEDLRSMVESNDTEWQGWLATLDQLPGVMGEGKVEAESAVSIFGGLRDQFGETADETNRLRAAQEGLGTGTDGATDSMVGQGDAAALLGEEFDALAQDVDTAAKALDDWRSIVDEVTGITMGAWDAATRWAAEVDSLSESLKENGDSFDVNTEKGRNNRDALSSVASQALDTAEAEGRLAGSVEVATLTMFAHRNQLIDTMVASGMSREAAILYVEALGLTPESVQTRFEENAPEAETRTRGFLGALNEIVPWLRTNIDADTRQAEAAIAGLSGRTITLDIRGRPDASITSVTGHPSARRWGGIDHYAAGGLRGAMIGTGRNLIHWDEPETGGEAYIPRLGDKNRNWATASTVADWLDATLVPNKQLTSFATGGVWGTTAPLPNQPPAPPVVNVTVEAPKGARGSTYQSNTVHNHDGPSTVRRSVSQLQDMILYGE